MLHEVNFKNLEELFKKNQCIGKTDNVKQEEAYLNINQLKPVLIKTPDDSDSDYSYESDEYESEEYESEENSSETDSHDSYSHQGRYKWEEESSSSD